MLLQHNTHNGIYNNPKTPFSLSIGDMGIKDGKTYPKSLDYFAFKAPAGDNSEFVRSQFHKCYGEQPKEVLISVFDFKKMENIANRVEKIEVFSLFEGKSATPDITAYYPIDKGVFNGFQKDNNAMIPFERIPNFNSQMALRRAKIKEIKEFDNEYDAMYASIIEDKSDLLSYPYAVYLFNKYYKGNKNIVIKTSFSFNFSVLYFDKSMAKYGKLTEDLFSFSTSSPISMNNINSFIEVNKSHEKGTPFLLQVTKVKSRSGKQYPLVNAVNDQTLINYISELLGSKNDFIGDYALQQGQSNNLLGSGGDNITDAEVEEA